MWRGAARSKVSRCRSLLLFLLLFLLDLGDVACDAVLAGVVLAPLLGLFLNLAEVLGLLPAVLRRHAQLEEQGLRIGLEAELRVAVRPVGVGQDLQDLLALLGGNLLGLLRPLRGAVAGDE